MWRISYIWLSLFLLYRIELAFTSKIDAKIYFTINDYHPCVLLTNATHQVGCTSDMNGNRGVVHLVNNHDDIDWMINKGPHKPYIPLLNYSMFIEPIMSKLMKSGKISGALVIHKNESGAPPSGFSPDEKCPNDKFGMYTNSKDYGSCQKVKWNPIGNGMSMVYYGIPIFLLTNKQEIDAIVKCFNENNYPKNGVARRYPLCGVEMKDFMFAAKDTPTCRRKTEMPNPIQSTYCDPLGDNNVFGTLYPLVGNTKKDDIIMVTARLDSTAFFHDFSPAADNAVTGIVTLLAAAKALGNYKRKMAEKNVTVTLKPIMFTLFNGEVWDYIGSSRMVWDMDRGTFPYKKENNRATFDDYATDIDGAMYMSKVNTSNIGYFVELSQLGLGEKGMVYAHSDPISQEDNAVKEKVRKILDAFMNASKITGAPFSAIPQAEKQPLPPASFQRFLRSRHIPGVVLADHDKEFKNKYYNSRFDNPENINLTYEREANKTYYRLNGNVMQQLLNTSKMVANAVFLLASDGEQPKEELMIEANLTANLLYCLLYSANCPAFKEVLDRKKSPLPTMPFSRYISVKQLDNPITAILHRVLAYYTGEILPESECKGKSSTSLPKVLSYSVAQGNGTFVCVRSSSYMTPALSPAFELNQYLSTEYSTWMESMWSGEMGIQMYLIADPTIEGIVLAAGLSVLIMSFIIVYFCNKKADILFTPNVLILNS